MAAITIIDTVNVLGGAIGGFTVTIGSVVNLHGLNIVQGSYYRSFANSTKGGLPAGGFQVFTLFTATYNNVGGWSPKRFLPLAGSVNGSFVDVVLGSFVHHLNGSFLLTVTVGTPAVVVAPGLICHVMT